MIRKANFFLLAALPLLAIAFILTNVRTGRATDYSGECPNVIGTVNVCPDGWTPEYTGGVNGGPLSTCHSGVYNGQSHCCQYETWYVTCRNGLVVQGLYGPVEYFRGSRPYYNCTSNGTCSYIQT